MAERTTRATGAASKMLNNVKIPPFVGALEPWPQRAIILVALAAFGFLVVLLPWHIVTRSNSLPAGHARRPEAARALGRSFSRASDHLGDDHVTRTHDQQPALHHGEVIR